MVNVSDSAAEQIKKSQVVAKCEGLPLRIALVGGGCSGPEYGLGFDEKGAEDAEFACNGIPVIIDPKTITKIEGLELDYVEDQQGASFVFRMPKAAHGHGHGHGGCGCGGGGGHGGGHC